MAEYGYEDLLEIVKTLRSENGCPWDRVQTHESLRPCLSEETAELLASVRILKETGDYTNMREELGDLLLQVVMHSTIAQEEGMFTMEDVVNEISEKMIRRHPHVFSDGTVTETAEVRQKWEEIKAEEKKGRTMVVTPLKEIPIELPALARAVKVLRKTDSVYGEHHNDEEYLHDLQDLVGKMGQTNGDCDLSDLLSEALMDISGIAANHKIYAEQILTDKVEEKIAEYE